MHPQIWSMTWNPWFGDIFDRFSWLQIARANHVRLLRFQQKLKSEYFIKSILLKKNVFDEIDFFLDLRKKLHRLFLKNQCKSSKNQLKFIVFCKFRGNFKFGDPRDFVLCFYSRNIVLVTTFFVINGFSKFQKILKVDTQARPTHLNLGWSERSTQSYSQNSQGWTTNYETHFISSF